MKTKAAQTPLFQSTTVDQQAFAALVTRHERSLRRYCFALLGSRAGAEEATQEVFMKIWRHRARYQDTASLRPLLFTIARNHCRSLLRRRRVLDWVGLEPSVLRTAESPELSADERFGQNQIINLVRSGLDELPEKFRTPLVLRFVEDLPYDEIAQVIGRTPSAARSRVHYGLKALGAALPKEVTEWTP